MATGKFHVKSLEFARRLIIYIPGDSYSWLLSSIKSSAYGRRGRKYIGPGAPCENKNPPACACMTVQWSVPTPSARPSRMHRHG